MTAQEAEIRTILEAGRDMTVATLMPDGAPHAVVVSYASEGLSIYFGCASDSQKARNLARDPRIAATVTLPYRDWGQIRGLSIAGRAQRLDTAAAEQAGVLFLKKFDELAQYAASETFKLALFRLTPHHVGLLDYRKGFGQVEQVTVAS